MAACFDVSHAEGHKSLDAYLQKRSYITGVEPSTDDLQLYVAFPCAPSTDLVNASRWYSHITGLIKATFPGAPAGIAVTAPAPAAPPAAASSAQVEDDEDEDLFGEETEEEKAATAARAASKSAASKKKESGKSSILMDIKPWDDETDMVMLEKYVRSLQMPGLHWGASKLVPVSFGIKKLQILLTVEDDLVSPDNLIEDHMAETEHIQSCDIVAFNKI